MTLLIVTIVIGGAVAIGLGWGWVVLTRHIQRPDVKTRIIKESVRTGTSDALARNLERTLRLQTLLAKVVPTHKNQLALAQHLLTQASVYDELAHPGEAVAHTEQAIEVYERLPQDDFVTYAVRLSTALESAASRYAEVDDDVRVLIAWRAVRDLYLQLNDRDPQRFGPSLGMALTNLGLACRPLDFDHEGLAAEEQAVQVLEPFGEADPDRHGHTLAWAWTNLSSFYEIFGRHEEALDLSQRALALYQRLAAAPPAQHERDREHEVVLLTSNLSVHLAAVGRHAEALEVSRQAESTARRRVEQGKELAVSDLAVVLDMLAQHHRDLGDDDKANSIQAEADALAAELPG